MNTLDRIMDEDPLNLTDVDIDELIAHYRRARTAPKGKAAKEDGPKVAIDLEKLGLVRPVPVGSVRRV